MRRTHVRHRRFGGGLTLVLAVIAGVLIPSVAAADQAQPNIIFIITDDQRRQELGFLEGRAHTPTIDQLARNGMVFDNCYVASSVCTPSRYTVLSGHYASRSETDYFKAQTTAEGMTRVTWNSGFTPDQPNVARLLQDAGYMTGFVGKWHIGGMRRPPGDPITPGDDPADPRVIERLEANQTAFAEHLNSFGFDYAARIYAGNPDDDQELKAVGLNIHNMEWITEGALRFIDQAHATDRPFFLYFSTTLTHSPAPVESLLGDPTLTPVGKLDEPITGVQPSRDDVVRRAKERDLPKELWAPLWLDDGVGALVAKLDELGIDENTLIVYFVDHGSEFQSKGTCYEGGLVAPTFFHMPGTIPAGVVQDALIQNTDFAPTFFEMAGVAPPGDMILDGFSLVDLLEGGDTPVRDVVFSEIGLTRSVRTANGWKYIAFRVPPSLERTLEERMSDQQAYLRDIHEKQPWTRDAEAFDIDPEARYMHQGREPGGIGFERYQIYGDVPFKANYYDRDQLYNLNVDPHETTNLADDPRHAAKLAEMQAELRRVLETLPGTFMDLKPVE